MAPLGVGWVARSAILVFNSYIFLAKGKPNWLSIRSNRWQNRFQVFIVPHHCLYSWKQRLDKIVSCSQSKAKKLCRRMLSIDVLGHNFKDVASICWIKVAKASIARESNQLIPHLFQRNIHESRESVSPKVGRWYNGYKSWRSHGELVDMGVNHFAEPQHKTWILNRPFYKNLRRRLKEAPMILLMA